MKKKKKNINSIKLESLLGCFILSAIFLLVFITITLVFTNILFILNISITKFHLPISFLISFILFFFLNKEKGNKIKLVSSFISVVIFLLFTVVVGSVYDGTSDGNTYHKLAVGAMKNGWNPVYQSVGDFNKKEGNPFDIYEDNVNINWVDHYAKGTETFAAVVYKSTNNIECGKVYNVLWIYIGMFILVSLFQKIGLSSIKSIILSFILAFNPIILVQMNNYYLDGVLAITLFLTILICLYQQKMVSIGEENLNYIILGCSLIWAINSKFNGLAFTGVFCLILYLYRHVRNFMYNRKSFKTSLMKDTIFYIIIVFLSVTIVGAGSYTKNFLDHGHPLYPLYGKNHVPSMIMMEIPKSMQNDSPLKTFAISIFAKGENVSPSYAEQVNEPNLKIPFTTSKEEINNYVIPDIRMGGFGPLFSAIFVLTIVMTVLIGIEFIKNRTWNQLIPYIIVLITVFLLISFIDGSYWARYIPYLYLIPCFNLIHYFQKEKLLRSIQLLLVLVVGLFFINSGLIFQVQLKNTYNNNNYLKIRKLKFIDESKSKEKIKIHLSHHGIQGVQYNIDDWNVSNYELTGENELENDCYMFTY